jgi:hypothetical protein
MSYEEEDTCMRVDEIEHEKLLRVEGLGTV